MFGFNSFYLFSPSTFFVFFRTMLLSFVAFWTCIRKILFVVACVCHDDDADKGLPAPQPPWPYAILMKHLKSINENKNPTKAADSR